MSAYDLASLLAADQARSELKVVSLGLAIGLVQPGDQLSLELGGHLRVTVGVGQNGVEDLVDPFVAGF